MTFFVDNLLVQVERNLQITSDTTDENVSPNISYNVNSSSDTARLPGKERGLLLLYIL